MAVVHDRPEVGRNLQDHLAVRVISKTREPITLNDEVHSWWRKARMAGNFALFRRGPMAYATGQVGMFFEVCEQAPAVDAQAFLLPFSIPGVGQLPHDFSAFSVSVTQSRPTSRGTVELRDANPQSAPVIRPRYLSTEEDRRFFVRALPKLRALLATSPIAAIVSEEYQPGVAVTSDEQVLDYVRSKAGSIYHPCGTCRMGADDDSVVDPRLRVREVAGLRVADASIMPRITSGNINATCLMIGEKAADLILADHS